MEENFVPLLQQFIEQGQAQVLSNLEAGEEGSSANLPEAVSEAIATGPSGLQELIAQGQSAVFANLAQDTAAATDDSSAPAVDFVAAEAGTVDPVTGSEIFGQVEFTTGGDSTPLFTLGAAGPVNPVSATSSGEGDSSAPAIDFVAAEAGTVDPVTGSEIFGQVEFTTGGDSTPLFTLGAAGPVNSVSADGQQLDFSAFVPSFISANQPVGDTSAI